MSYEIFKDVSYFNTSNSQKMDIYLPKDKKQCPCVMFIHGGAWLRGDKDEEFIRRPILEFVKNGYAVASINFRFSTEAMFPSAHDDAKNALEFLIKNAKNYNIDENQIALLGYSVGANMASITGLENEKVKAVVALYGPYDFLNMIKGFEALNIMPFAPDPTQYASSYAKDLNKLNPINYLKENAPDFFISHGTMDNVVAFTQSVAFVNELSKISKNKVEFKPILGAKHLDTKFFEDKFLKEIFEFLKSSLKD